MQNQREQAIKAIAQINLGIKEPAPTGLYVQFVQWESALHRDRFSCWLGNLNHLTYIYYPYWGVFTIDLALQTVIFIPSIEHALIPEEIHYLFATRICSYLYHSHAISNFHGSAFIETDSNEATVVFGLPGSGKTEYIISLLKSDPDLALLADDLVLIDLHKGSLSVCDLNPHCMLKRVKDRFAMYPNFEREAIVIPYRIGSMGWVKIGKIILLNDVSGVDLPHYLRERIYNYQLLLKTSYEKYVNKSIDIVDNMVKLVRI
ncbi:hypothetical protein HGA91_05880 [candidate division WWE3 bacterium]|nr:hypothetical protein [candidate division WWE3 bacterium]